MTKDVVFEPTDGRINNRIDEAYRTKYGGSPYLSPMIGTRARSASGRGMGVDFAKAALAAGHAVVATGPKQRRRVQGLGTVQRPAERHAGRHAPHRCRDGSAPAIDRFGRIDVLVNNAASFYAGYFEELTPEQFERQLSVSVIGPMNVTRAVLPVMRKQRSGQIISISSSAGLAAGFDFVSAYAASKFGLEGWMESLHAEVAPFGLSTTVINPGFFRTEPPHGAIDELRRTVHRGLRRAPRATARVLEVTEREAIRRPREARASAHRACQPGAAAAPLHRWRRCDYHDRTEGR
jgi:NAD(P)-dependent dehydrogenase (short-subunit alcohol dehydrogenase family)